MNEGISPIEVARAISKMASATASSSARPTCQRAAFAATGVALATATGFGNPRRMSTGFDYNRMNLIIAVLEKRAGYYFSNTDAYINVIGGLRLDETAVDLAVAMALVSSLKDVPIADDAIAFGEIGLAGEIRSVNHAQQRVNEAVRLGFKRIIVPAHNAKDIAVPSDAQVIPVRNVRQAFEAICE